MGVKLITPASDTIISLVDAKAHLRVDHTDDDALIGALIDAVVSYVEGPRGYLARALADQEWDYYLDGFPDRNWNHRTSSEIEIPLPPLIELVGVFYRDSAGAEQEWDAANYIVDIASEPARISLASGKCWPSICAGLNAVRIRFRAGYLDNSSPPAFALPAAIKAGLLLYIGTLYENRSETIVGEVANRMPFASEALLRPFVAQRGFA
jgi:uncharacterized phiE125 gp8 family phage protein